MATEVSREQFFGMAGLNAVDGAYTPISLGKGGKMRDGNASWIKNLRTLDFTDAQGLRSLTPETVSVSKVFVNDEEQTKYKAIVGDVTHKVYSIKSDRYQIAQNKLIIDALAQVSDDTGIGVFGKMNDECGRMSCHAFFADPDCNIDFGTRDPFSNNYQSGKKDPYMLGVRAYNSHMGDRGFGAEIVGVRALCSNMVAFGDILGRVSWKHLVTEDKIVDMIIGMVKGYMNQVPVLKDRIEAMNNEVLTLDEAECALWGIKLSPFKTESIMSNLVELNPEIKGKNGKVSVYDVFNATTAYNTYSNTGGTEFGRTEISHKAQDLIINDASELVDKGAEARRKYFETHEITLSAQNTVLVAD